MEVIYARFMPEDYAELVPKKTFFNIALSDIQGLRPDQKMCIGWRFLGGHPNQKDSYVYDHTNIWVEDESTRLDEETVTSILAANGLTLNRLIDKILD